MLVLRALNTSRSRTLPALMQDLERDRGRHLDLTDLTRI
jgi:hypothetical protein